MIEEAEQIVYHFIHYACKTAERCRESGKRAAETYSTRLTSAVPSVNLIPPAGEAALSDAFIHQNTSTQNTAHLGGVCSLMTIFACLFEIRPGELHKTCRECVIFSSKSNEKRREIMKGFLDYDI